MLKGTLALGFIRRGTRTTTTTIIIALMEVALCDWNHYHSLKRLKKKKMEGEKTRRSESLLVTYIVCLFPEGEKERRSWQGLHATILPQPCSQPGSLVYLGMPGIFSRPRKWTQSLILWSPISHGRGPTACTIAVGLKSVLTNCVHNWLLFLVNISHFNLIQHINLCTLLGTIIKPKYSGASRWRDG